jgi:23S rRNA pseudouridine2605 synthase
MAEPVRLQKVLAAAGIGSRRKCEILIERGRVRVDGALVTELGTRVDPDRAVIHVDGRRVPTRTDLVVVALNKPRGVLSTMSDPQGRPTVGQYVADLPQRLFHVGRLDADTEGLLLLTNDGDLANRLGHPSHGVLKTYVATIDAPVPAGLGKRLKDGVELDDGPAKVASFRVLQVHGGRAMVELSLHEGRNRIVRRLLAAQDRPVAALVRTVIGPIQLGDQRPGTVRRIEGEELRRLYDVAGR